MKAIFNKNNLIYFLLLFALLPQLIQLDSEWNMMDGDDAQYIIHARSLIENQVYNDHKLIYTPIPFYGSKSAQPGWPLILVPFVFIFGVNLLKLKIIVIVLALASGVVLLNIIKKMRDGCWLSYYITAIYFFSMTTIVFSRVLYTEWPYLFFSLIIIYQLIKEHRELSSTRKTVLIGLFIGLLFLFRSVAICMLLAVIAIIIQNKMIHERKIWIGLKSICIILIIAAGTHEAVSFMVKPEKSQDYTEQFLLKDINFYEEGKASFLDVVERIPQNGYSALKGMEPTFLGRNWHEYIEYVSPKAFKITQVILLSSGTLLTIFILIGFISEVIRGPTVIEYYTFFYSGLMSIVWFHYEVYRYLMPIVPFLFFYFFVGIYRGLNRIMKQSERVKPLIKKLAIVFLVINIAHAGVEIYRYKFSSQNAKQYLNHIMSLYRG